MIRAKNLILLLVVCSVSTFSLIMLASCETKPVDPISEEPIIPGTDASQVVGQITDYITDVGISSVSVELGNFNTTTDAEGNFELGDNIPGGNYTLIAGKAGYISISKNVTLPGVGYTTHLKYTLALTNPTVTVTPAGAIIEEESNDGTLTAFIPANAVSANTEVSLTPTLGLSTPIKTYELIAANEAPLQTFTIEPININFSQPVTMTVPLTMPAGYIIGTIEVVRVNIETGEAEVVGTATIVNGEIVFDITTGGDFMLRVETGLTHYVQTMSEYVQVGKIGANELPGTAVIVDYDDDASVLVGSGFSQDLIETIFGFGASSRTLSYGLSKPVGANTSVTAFLPVINKIHTYTTTLGKVVAGTTSPNQLNEGNKSDGVSVVIYKYTCVETPGSGTHGPTTWVAEWEANTPQNIIDTTPTFCP